MNPQQAALYQRIQAFAFEPTAVTLSFVQRLAREHAWSLVYAERVVAEYKKFAFLAVAAGHPVTPSEPVDRVWHLHLSYTRSYWEHFGPEVLQMPLHHEPTQGGPAEQQKFHRWYAQTLASYTQFFGEAPPADIWAEPQDRFGHHGQFVWVNSHQNWIVPKPRLMFSAGQSQKLLILGLLLFLVWAFQGQASPLEFTGSAFLTFYFLLAVLAIAVASSLRSALRLPAPTEAAVSLDTYEAAYLAAGAGRAVDTVLTGFIQKEWVTVQANALVWQGIETDFSHALESAVAEAIAIHGTLSAVRLAAGPSLRTVREQLQSLGLLVKPAQACQAQLVPALAIAALLGLGAIKIWVGLARGKPVGFLLLMSIGVAIASLGFALQPVQRSRWGDRVLRELRAPVAKETMEHNDPQLSWAFALWGIAVLPDAGFADWKKLLTPVPPTDGGASTISAGDWGGASDSGGGSGCGGCGGCSSN